MVSFANVAPLRKEGKIRREKEERDSFSSALYDIFFPSTRMRSLVTHD
jgi:hypothetical protein